MARSNENDLTEKLAEGHRKYGDGNFTVQNIGDETNPNWTVVKNVRKGSAGIREGEDILRLRSKYIKQYGNEWAESSNPSQDAEKTLLSFDNKVFCLVINKLLKYKTIIFYMVLFLRINKPVKGDLVHLFKLLC